MAPENDGWDPEHPEILSATGLPKKQGGWKGWGLAFLAIGLSLGAWLLWGRE